MVRGEESLEEVCDKNRAASMVSTSIIMHSGLPNTGNVNGVKTSPSQPSFNQRLGVSDRYEVRISTWNVGTLTDKSIRKYVKE